MKRQSHHSILWIWLDDWRVLEDNGNCQRLVFSLGVSQHMHKISNLWKLELNWSSKFCEIILKEKTPLSHEVVCVQMLDFETSNSKPEVSKSNSGKTNSFSKTTPLQREPYLTMIYIITPLTNILPFLWFRARHMICLSFTRRRPCDSASFAVW